MKRRPTLPWFLILATLGISSAGAAAVEFEREIRPLLQHFCLTCHSAEKHKGDLDLERFVTFDEVMKHPKVWQDVLDQLQLGEMPPREKSQPTAGEREQLLAWLNATLDEAARAHAGDPGPVVLRRLSNAEYTYTIRDLTGVATLDPAREFPTDSASGEGFMNVGNSLVMSPALLAKYLDAGKDIASHAVLLPDGIGFSSKTSTRDWTEEKLAAIRQFYGRFTEPGGGSAVNLQGIKFDTRDGGVLPLAKYLEATMELRQSGTRAESAAPALISAVATRHNLSPKYLANLWRALDSPQSSLLLDPIRAQWRVARPGDGAELVKSIVPWQQSLWRFTQVGHIGKRDGPKAWQVPVTPLTGAREIRMKLPAPAAGKDEVTVYLAASDAGDGNQNDFAVWENPRLVAPGRPDLALRDVRSAMNTLTTSRAKVFSGAVQSLAAAAEITGAPDATAVAQLAAKHNVEPAVLQAWLECLGIPTGETRIDSHLTQKLESAQGYDFIQGWTGADALSVIANSSDQHVRVPGNMKPHSIAVHPSPQLRVVVGWRSPVATTLRIEGAVQHAHPECGNGVTWAVELRRGNSRQSLASGTAQGSKGVKFGPFQNIPVQPGDVVAVVVGPRDGNHSCDLTAVDLDLSDGSRHWNLANEISPNLLAGNPHADSLGHAEVWHFYSEPDKDTGVTPALPADSLLAKWQTSGNAGERQRLAEELQRLLLAGPESLPAGPDTALYRLLTSPNGPLLGTFLRDHRRAEAPATNRNPTQALHDDPIAIAPAGRQWGLDPTLFGRGSGGPKIADVSLGVRAPSLVEVRLPADLVEGCELVATGTLEPGAGSEGSVQMQVLATKPATLGLAAGLVKEQGGKSTWSDGERPVVSDSPILVAEGSAARKRIEGAFEEFRQLFPAALCYTKIVPVDEVVTLTLFYREDDQLRRLVLDDSQAAEIDRLWAELHYVSQDALKLVDAFEQLWQFATQDADPSAFEPLRQPIQQRAAEFRKLLADTQPTHLDATLKLAEDAYRRPLSDTERDELRGLYRRLREEGIPHDAAIRLTLARVLVAPAFLYRTEKPGPGDSPVAVSDWELATRLSYFLWSSEPDADLRIAAARGRLHDPVELSAQARRLLRDPRVRRLATEFACAWLHVYDFDQLGEKSERQFPTFAGLRGDMYEETIRFFTDLFQHDGSVLDILDADYTFLNAALAKHYGMEEVFRGGQPVHTDNSSTVGRGEASLKTPNPPSAIRNSQNPVTPTAATEGDGWRRVDGVRQFGRGGILAQATTLAKQSGASRTSPILRGNWLCEVLLGEKLPRPPKDVPRLPEDEATETLTVRQLTEKHSTDPKCFVCHRRIDPYGYSLEAYDAIGRFRDRDLGGRPVEVKAQAMDGSEIDGLEGLRRYLLTTRREAFVKQFCRKLLGYSLGRGVLLSDGPLLSEMRDQLQSHEYRVSAAVEAIVRSRQFRDIRGKEMAQD